MNKQTEINGKKICAAIRSNINRGVTRVWLEGQTEKYLVIGYDNQGGFDEVVGVWSEPENESYLSSECKEYYFCD